jgi:S-(hydroxymethyl)glutathione dehydrogenase / alcohol dehydrogenase
VTVVARAAVLEEIGRPVVVRELDLIEPRAGEVLVLMLASGVCHSDLHVRDGEWDRPTPIVMGHEGAGIVGAVGSGVDSPRVGDLVALAWLIPCGVCRWCRRGETWACPDSPSYRHTLLDGSMAFGDVRSYCAIATMASASVVPAAAAIPVPPQTDPAAAALIGCCVTTGVGAVLKTAAVSPGSSVAVIGLGGVGLSCVMGAVVAEASRIVAIDRVAGKLEVARSIGATDAILASEDAAATVEALRDLTNGGPDFVFEAIGRPSTIELAIGSMPVSGTAVLVGMTPLGERASFEVYPFVDGAKRIIGSNYGSAEPAIDFPRYSSWSIDGRLPVGTLVDRRITLDDVEDAFAAMREGRFIRQVIEFSS